MLNLQISFRNFYSEVQFTLHMPWPALNPINKKLIKEYIACHFDKNLALLIIPGPGIITAELYKAKENK